jgi:hypothetical protein
MPCSCSRDRVSTRSSTRAQVWRGRIGCPSANAELVSVTSLTRVFWRVGAFRATLQVASTELNDVRDRQQPPGGARASRARAVPDRARHAHPDEVPPSARGRAVRSAPRPRRSQRVSSGRTRTTSGSMPSASSTSTTATSLRSPLAPIHGALKVPDEQGKRREGAARRISLGSVIGSAASVRCPTTFPSGAIATAWRGRRELHDEGGSTARLVSSPRAALV